MNYFQHLKTKNINFFTSVWPYPLFIFFFLFVPVQLFGPSMIPTFNVKNDGDLIITEHLSAQFRTIKK